MEKVLISDKGYRKLESINAELEKMGIRISADDIEKMYSDIESDTLMDYVHYLKYNKLIDLNGRIDKIFQPSFLQKFVELENTVEKMERSQNKQEVIGDLKEFFDKFFEPFKDSIDDKKSYEDLRTFVDAYYYPLNIKSQFKMTEDAKAMYKFAKKEEFEKLFVSKLMKKVNDVYCQIKKAYSKKIPFHDEDHSDKMFGLTHRYKIRYYKLYNKGFYSDELIFNALNINNALKDIEMKQQTDNRQIVVSEFDNILNNFNHVADVFSPELLEKIQNNNQLTDAKKQNFETIKNTIVDSICNQKSELTRDEILNLISNPDFDYKTYIEHETSDKSDLMDNVFNCNILTNYVVTNDDAYKMRGIIQVRPEQNDKNMLAMAIKITKVEIVPGKYQLLEEHVSVPITEYNDKMEELRTNYLNTTGIEIQENDLQLYSTVVMRYLCSTSPVQRDSREGLKLLLSNGKLIEDYEKYNADFEKKNNHRIIDNICSDGQIINIWTPSNTFSFDNRKLDENGNIVSLSKQLSSAKKTSVENNNVKKESINQEKETKINQINENNNAILELQKQLEALKEQNVSLEQSLNKESDGMSI